MSRRRSANLDKFGKPDPIFVRYTSSDAGVFRYIVCINGRIPEKYELWRLNGAVVRKVLPTARIKLLDVFAEDTFRSIFYILQACRVIFIGCRSVNGSVEFIRFLNIIEDSTLDIISTRNIFVHFWGEYPTLIDTPCSRYTSRAYVPITSQKVFDQRCEHERLCLLFSDQKRTASRRNFSRVRENLCDDVTMGYDFPPGNNLLGDASPANSPRSLSSNHSDSGDKWVQIDGSIKALHGDRKSVVECLNRH